MISRTRKSPRRFALARDESFGLHSKTALEVSLQEGALGRAPALALCNQGQVTKQLKL